MSSLLLVVLNQALAGHVGGLLQSHDVQDAGSNVGQTAVLHGGAVVVGHVDEGHGVQRVSGVGRAVGVHGVEAAHDAGDGGIVGGTDVADLLDEALARAGVGVATVHVAVYEDLVLQTVGLADFDELEQVVEAGAYAAVRAEAHQVELLALLLGIAVGSLYLRVLHDAAVLAGAVDLHQVLVDDAAGADVEVAHLGVTHLSVGQTDILARGCQLRVCAGGC